MHISTESTSCNEGSWILFYKLLVPEPKGGFNIESKKYHWTFLGISLSLARGPGQAHGQEAQKLLNDQLIFDDAD